MFVRYNQKTGDINLISSDKSNIAAVEGNVIQEVDGIPERMPGDNLRMVNGEVVVIPGEPVISMEVQLPIEEQLQLIQDQLTFLLSRSGVDIPDEQLDAASDRISTVVGADLSIANGRESDWPNLT